VKLHATLARLSALVLLLLAASPYTAPFAVCDLTDGSHGHAATRHLSHASAVVRPAAKIARHPIVLSLGITRDVALPYRSDLHLLAIAWQPPAPARDLVLRL
jgi:hypothetical protein